MNTAETVDIRELVGITEVARIVGLAPSTIRGYSTKGTLPEPALRLACGPIWRRSDIEAWEAERRART